MRSDVGTKKELEPLLGAAPVESRTLHFRPRIPSRLSPGVIGRSVNSKLSRYALVSTTGQKRGVIERRWAPVAGSAQTFHVTVPSWNSAPSVAGTTGWLLPVVPA